MIDVLAPLAADRGRGRLRAALRDARARRGAPVALWRQALVRRRGPRCCSRADLPPLSTVAEELVVAHMAQHLLIGDLAGAADRPRAHRPAAAAAARAAPVRLAARARQPARRAAAVGAQPLPLAPLGALRGRARRARCCTSPSTPASSPSGSRCGCRWSGRCRSRRGSATAAMLVYVVVVRLLEAVLANVLIWSGDVLYPDYAPGEAQWEIGPLADQGAAGNVMMIWTGTVTLALFAWLFFRAANRSAEKQELLDLAEAHGFELDPARAARAVAAGQGDRLRERILGGDDDGSSTPSAQPASSTLLVFVVGTASLGAEIAAARLMAPFFGASTIVWANTIGVVLVALSIGYWLGGRLADRRPDVRSLCLVVIAAAVLLAVVPLVAQAVLRPLRRRARRDRGRGLRRLAVRGPVPDRDPGGPARHLLAVGAAARGHGRRARRAGRRAPVRDLDRRLADRDDARGAGADPAGRHAADLPRLRAGAGAGRRGRPRLALRRRPRGARGRDRASGRDGEGDRRGPRALRGRVRAAVHPRDRGARRRPDPRAQRGPGRALDAAGTRLPDRRLLGQLPRAPVRGPRRGRRAGSRSSATPRARSPAPTATSSRGPRSTGSRSTPSSPRSATATSTWARTRT